MKSTIPVAIRLSRDTEKEFGMRSKLFLAAFAAVALVLATSGQSAALDGVQFGAEASFASDTDFGIGGRVVVPLEMGGGNLNVIGTFDYFFVGDDYGDYTVDINYFEINANVAYGFDIGSNIEPYAGGGLRIGHIGGDLVDGDTLIGVNILGGAKFGVDSSITPFAEFRVSFGDGDQVYITGGILF